MRRKQTELESNLFKLGYRLDHKTYCGRKSEKVFEYVFIKYKDRTIYYVYLDRERNKINDYGFNSNKYFQYNKATIGDIKDTFNEFEEELKSIYDFNEGKTLEMVDPLDLDDYPLLDEGVIDDDNVD